MPQNAINKPKTNSSTGFFNEAKTPTKENLQTTSQVLQTAKEEDKAELFEPGEDVNPKVTHRFGI